MSGSFALRKLLYAESEAGEYRFRGYHNLGAYDALLHSAWVEQPAAVQPRSRYRFASLCLVSSFLTCFFMKKRNKEKWWLGTFLITCVYYSSVKAHKVNNGLVGHQSGFFAAGMGVIGFGSRLILNSGTRKINVSGMLLFLAMMWYELGRFHLWSEYVTEFRRITAPQRSFNLLDEYIDPTCKVELLPYRAVG